MMGQSRAVLIVEDDAELRSLMATLLEDGKRDIIECESAEAALAIMLIRGREVAVIFADVRLPGVMNGVDLAWAVKMRWPFLPAILTSGIRSSWSMIALSMFCRTPPAKYSRAQVFSLMEVLPAL